MKNFLKLSVLFVNFFTIYQTARSENLPSMRLDLHKNWHEKICASLIKNQSLDDFKLENDAQSQLKIYRNNSPYNITEREIQQFIIKQAKLLDHHGFGFGICDNKFAWGISTPSPVLIKLTDNEIVLPQGEILTLCQKLIVNFSEKERGLSIELQPNKNIVEIPKDKSGILSITCESKTKKSNGNVLWALIRISGYELNYAPFIDDFSTLDSNTIITWINKIRIKETLNPLLEEKNLSTSAQKLGQRLSITHDRTLLISERKNLAHEKIHFLGENRVQAKTLQEVLILLWNSPRHRDLLLHPKATNLGISINKESNDYFLVITIGDKLSHRPTAKL